MKKIVIATAGTCGDLFPYLALGRELVNRGYAVVMSVSEPLLHHVRAEGLEGVACRPAMGAEEAARNAQDWDHWDSNSLLRLTNVSDTGIRQFDHRFEDLLQICEGADALLCSPVQFIGQSVYEKTGIPWLTVAVMPFLFAQRTEEHQASPEVEAGMKAYVTEFNAFRRRHGLSLRTLESLKRPAMSSDALLAASRIFFDPAEGGGPDNVITTNFWYYKAPQWRDWQPEEKLRTFMAADLPPLVLTFSSLPLSDPERVVRIHTEAARRLGRRLLILSGWAGFQGEHSENPMVYTAEFLPHDWVFQRAGAVIHHGGIGTLACCLQQRCPMLIEPYGNDQFFNARQVLIHGLGAAMHPHRLTVAEVTRVLAERVLTDEIRVRAERFAALLLKERGLAAGADFVEQWISGV